LRSQEVRDGSAVRHRTLPVVHRQENLELALEVLVDLQDRGDVTTSVAVVRGRPDRDQALTEPVLESVHDELMRTRDEFEVVDVVELVCDTRAKQPACATG